MKRTEAYRLLPKLKGTDEEKRIVRETNDFLMKNYIELHTKSFQYLHKEGNSLMLITSTKDICKDEFIEIQIEPHDAKTPKELSDLLNEKGFIKFSII